MPLMPDTSPFKSSSIEALAPMRAPPSNADQGVKLVVSTGATVARGGSCRQGVVRHAAGGGIDQVSTSS